MDTKKKNKPVKKKVLKKGSGNSQEVSPSPTILKKGTKNPSGVSAEEKRQAVNNVLYVEGKKGTMSMKDIYPALLNRVKEKCNARDRSTYESSTNDPAIRKDFERVIGDLRRAGYLSPVNKQNTVSLLKVIPPGVKLPKNGKA
jgi:hypothetical protein